MRKLVFTLIIFGCTLLSAQETQIIHHMNWIPQSARSNPAQIPDYNFYIGLPVISSLYLDVDHGISFNDVVQRLPGDTFLVDPGFALNNMKENNYISISTDVDLLSFGFRARKSFLTFSISERNRFRFSLPKSMLEFAWKGNGAFVGEYVDMSSFAVEASAHMEVAFGLSLPVTERWIAAGRLKLLSGLGHAHFQANSLELYTNPESYAIQLRSGMDLFTAGADLDLSESFNLDVNTDYFLFRNPGMALDLAATYMATKKLRIGAGISDLGAIRWEAGAKRHYIQDGSYTFSGLEIGDVFKADSIDFDNQIEKIIDTLEIIFDLQSEESSYTRSLRPVIFLSGEYQLNNKNRFGALLRAEYFADQLYPTLNLSYHHRFGRILSLSGSYTMRNRSYYDIGGGLALKLGPMQLYVLGDNIFSVFWPEDIRSYSVHFGLNFVFGRPHARIDKLIRKLDEDPVLQLK